MRLYYGEHSLRKSFVCYFTFRKLKKAILKIPMSSHSADRTNGIPIHSLRNVTVGRSKVERR
jgi:hypothetical protein